jgi:LPS sulfotransferase NodH
VKLRARQAGHLPALVSGGRIERPVFIVGAPRSGTSILFSVLRSSSHLAHWPGEAHEVWEADHHPALRGWDSNVLGAGDATDETRKRIRRAFLLTAGSRKRLIDKTPRNSLRVPFIDHIFPDALYVFLVRDGRDNVNSLINAWRTPRYRTYELPERHAIPGADPRWWKFVLYPGWREDVHGPLERVAAKQWVAANEHMLDAFADIPDERWTEVRYEVLVENPANEVARILDFIGVEKEHELLDKARALKQTPINVVTPPERGKWKRENPTEIASVMPLIRPTMKRLGYPTDEE